jgi:hypothetical protein
MTPKFITATPKQLWAHLLCESCERRLNELGEKPVQKLFNGANGFPLLDRMNVALAVESKPTVVTYSGSDMGIDTEALAYYALSLLWKGSVHNWATLQGQTSSVNLGKYQEPIRQYLLGDAGFPDGVYVIVAVCTDYGSQGMNFAPSLVAGSQFPMFSILVRGLWFHVITTDSPAPGLEKLCCVRSEKKILHKEDCANRFLEAGRHLHKTAVVSPKLKD